MITIPVLATTALILLGTFAAEKISIFQKKQITTGILFGVIGGIVNLTFYALSGSHFFPGGVGDVPVIIAGFFFSTTAGLLAGVITAAERAISVLFEDGPGIGPASSFAILLVSVYAVAMKKWIFDGKRPPVIPAIVAAVFGELLHLLIIFLLGLGDLSRTMEVLYDAIFPVTVSAGVLTGLAGLLCGAWRGWKENLFSVFTLLSVSLGLSILAIAFYSLRNSEYQTDNAIKLALDKLDTDINDQIGFLLHCNATQLVSRIGDKPIKLSFEEMCRLANDYDVDEMNIKLADGSTLASNDKQVLAGKKKFLRSDSKVKRYFDLLDGKTDFVEQPFRPGINNPDVVAKYIGIPFPDRQGFLQLGYTWKRLGEKFSTYFFSMLANSRVAESGYILVTDPEGRIVVPVYGHPEAVGRTLKEIGMTGMQTAKTGELFYTRPFGAWTRCAAYKTIGNWHIFVALPVTEYQVFAIGTIFVSGLILFLFCAAFRIIMLRFVQAQKKIDDLRAAEEKRREEDMALASKIQTSDLRVDDPDTEYYRIRASMTPAKEVGGDFYDYYELPEDRLVVTIADVSGKGIPAAIFMMKAKATLKNALTSGASLTEAMQQANNCLNQNNDASMFVTAWVGILNLKNGIVSYCSAGHNAPLVRHADRSVSWIKGKVSIPLGVFPGAPYQEISVSLNREDELFLYTDGVTEAMDPAGELYGNPRLEQALLKVKDCALDEIRADLKTFANGAPQADDITILTMQFKGKA